MNRAQRTVVLVVSCALAATLFLGVPKRGTYGWVPPLKEQAEWDKKADRLHLSALDEMTGVAEEKLGPRPSSDSLVRRFYGEPDANEVALRYLLPVALVGFGLFVWLGRPKEGPAA